MPPLSVDICSTGCECHHYT